MVVATQKTTHNNKSRMEMYPKYMRKWMEFKQVSEMMWWNKLLILAWFCADFLLGNHSITVFGPLNFRALQKVSQKRHKPHSKQRHEYLPYALCTLYSNAWYRGAMPENIKAGFALHELFHLMGISSIQGFQSWSVLFYFSTTCIYVRVSIQMFRTLWSQFIYWGRWTIWSQKQLKLLTVNWSTTQAGSRRFKNILLWPTHRIRMK